MNVNGALTISGVATCVIGVTIGCRHSAIKYWPPLSAKEKAASSMTHSENERQWRINDF